MFAKQSARQPQWVTPCFALLSENFLLTIGTRFAIVDVASRCVEVELVG